MEERTPDKNKSQAAFLFRDLHPNVFMGTASDRYSGWIGQIYSREQYGDRISKRSKTVGGRTVTEEVLPVESVEEYFRHFSVLELDFTFYSLLLDQNLKPTSTYRVLETYRKYLGKMDRLILKVPQVVFAQKITRGGKFQQNPDYLNPEIFTRRFYEPAKELLGSAITGFIFEQEYQLKRERTPPDAFARVLQGFFRKIPEDERYHIEVRTETLLSVPYFQLLAQQGIGQVLSHWTWLPPLRKQFIKGAQRFLNAGKHCVIRLMTPSGMRYEEAYHKAFPFDKLVDGMMSPNMVDEAAEIMQEATRRGVNVDVVINNRAGGNA
ncbi:MAG: DUF72 domain-containing protein, partial [Pseudomonadota bacterium]